MTSRKTILILMHNYAIQFIDIANQYVNLFDPQKYKVTVAYLSGKPDDAAKAKTLAEEVLFLNCSKQSIRGMKINAIKKLVALCQAQKFSIVICHRYKPIYVMLWAAQFCQIPALIFVMHAMKTLNFLARKLLIAGLMRNNMYFAGVSNAVRDDLRKNLWRVSPDRVITLYNCIDIKMSEVKLLSRDAARTYLQLPKDTLVFGTVGRLAPEKDQKNIIQAFQKTKAQFPEAKLLIIGDGPLEHDLKKLAEQLNLTEDVIFTGFIPDALRYLKALDIFILSSTKEAFGRVLLEAMLAKVPVIGTRINGIPEVILDAGIIIEPRNSDLLAHAMTNMAEHTQDEMIAWGDKVYAHVKKHFSLERFNEMFWQIPLLKSVSS